MAQTGLDDLECEETVHIVLGYELVRHVGVCAPPQVEFVNDRVAYFLDVLASHSTDGTGC